jgi:uracil-DNA glycosylase
VSPAGDPPRRPPQLPESWLAVLGDEFEQPWMDELRAFLRAEKREHEVYPPSGEIFSAFWHTPFPAVRVVILGQDPYHGPGQAHGLSFSVRRGVRPPPSLQNIYRELQDDLGLAPPAHGELTAWADAGVLLLNTCLTVRARTPNSHRGRGWERFTDRVVRELAARREGLAFVLWGAAAAQKAADLDLSRHLVIRSAHPSPYSAASGFFGSRPFSRVNEWFVARGEPPVEWALG